MSAPFTYWQEPSGYWLGYWNEYPEHVTQGGTFEELKEMLVSLREDICAMVADGTMADERRNVGELAFARPRMKPLTAIPEGTLQSIFNGAGLPKPRR